MADCPVQPLLDNAACFDALTAGQKKTVELQLLCEVKTNQEGGAAAGVSRYPALGVAQALASSAVIKASPGTLLSLVFTNTNAAARSVQIFDSATVPADAAVPLISVSVAAGASLTFEWAGGLPVSAGISVANSTTAATKTIGSADSFFTATYR